MEKQSKTKQWHWPIDQWLEDKVWAKIPEEYKTPHTMFMLGFVTCTGLFIILGLIF